MNKTVFALAAWCLTATTMRADTTTEFVAELNSAHVIAGGVGGTSSTLVGTATFVLTQPAVGEPTLAYMISLPGADFDGTETAELADNVTAIHLHDSNVCIAGGCLPGDTAGTKHVLNIFGVPRPDDADLVVNAAAETVAGLWDESDANDLMPAPSEKPSDSLSQLLNGELFLMIHTQTEPAGAYGGFLIPVPEPGTVCLALAGMGVFAMRRARQ